MSSTDNEINGPKPELSQQEINDSLLQKLPASVKEQPYMHHGLPMLVRIDDNPVENSSSSGNTVRDGEQNFETRVYGELAEHDHLGNSIRLQDPADKSKSVKAKDLKIKLENGLELTYGQINWLAGDFYGTNDPISDGADENERIANFRKAFAYLAERPEAKAEAEAIIKEGQTEIDMVNQAIDQHEDPSTAYPAIEKLVPWEAWYNLTDNRPNGMGYIGLAQKNFDHFGEDAEKAYNAGHAYALSIAAAGDLNKGYALNAFADHFLEDRFSAGHLRTPRRFCHLKTPWNINGLGALDVASLCAKFMHDEDSAIGLQVANKAGESWTCYGDKRMLDKENGENKFRCVLALKQSTKEIEDAFNNGRVPEEVGLVWDIAPTLESARDQSKQQLSPLFTPEGHVRDDKKNRRDPSHSAAPGWQTWFGWFADIARQCYVSGRWNDPIQM